MAAPCESSFRKHITMKEILVPVDFSDVMEATLAATIGLAAGLGARVHLLHVAAPDPAFVGYEAGPDTVRHHRAEQLRSEHRAMEALADQLRNRGIETTSSLVAGPAVDTILAQAERLGADLIVMGSHGRGALYRALVGSVSEGVLRRSTTPVLVIPSRRPEPG